MLTLTSYRLFVVAAFAVCIFARMRLLVCEHPAVTFGSSAHGSLLRAKFQFVDLLIAGNYEILELKFSRYQNNVTCFWQKI